MEGSSLIRALATPRRREILRLLWDRERPAGDVHRALGDVTFGAVSQHLRVLERAGAVEARREGRQRFYVARRAGLESFARWLEGMWDDALYRLRLEAELEEARRGPRAGRRRRPRSGPGPSSRHEVRSRTRARGGGKIEEEP